MDYQEFHASGLKWISGFLMNKPADEISCVWVWLRLFWCNWDWGQQRSEGFLREPVFKLGIELASCTLNESPCICTVWSGSQEKYTPTPYRRCWCKNLSCNTKSTLLLLEPPHLIYAIVVSSSCSNFLRIGIHHVRCWFHFHFHSFVHHLHMWCSVAVLL